MKKRVITLIGTIMLGPHSSYGPYIKPTFTLTELKTIKERQNCPPDGTKKISATTHGNSPTLTFLPSYEVAFWWQLFPTTGLQTTHSSPPYPYLPHAYPLWELAPTLGKTSTVTLIDTGVFGFSFSTPTHTYVTHPDLTITGDFLHEPHNTIPFEGKSSDPFKNLATFIMHHTKEDLRNIKKMYQVLPGWILEYLQHKTTVALDAYLQENGSSDLFERNILFFLSPKKLLSAEGKRVKNSVLFSEDGFSHFTVATLLSGEQTVAECIPTVSLALPLTSMTDHATHVASIIGARPPSCSSVPFHNLLTSDQGFCGLAPYCSLRVIKALYEGHQTTTDVTHIIQALELTTEYHTDIINLSLKLDDTVDPHDPVFKKLEKILTAFPYFCCATGNEGTKKPGRMSYPARFKNVPFSVGSFGCFYDKKKNSYTCPLSSFSQYEKGKGPSFVAPGENILGCSSAYDKKEPLYTLKSGTSCATAFMSGALALILGEFKNDFPPAQLLTVCQTSCFKLHATQEWKEHVIYGVLDIRTALFTLHVLKKIRSCMPPSLFEKQFSLILTLIHRDLFALPTQYGKVHHILPSFKESFIDYYNASLATNACTALSKGWLTLPIAIDTLAHKIIKENSFPSCY
jgi:subtilisin family serine protease